MLYGYPIYGDIDLSSPLYKSGSPPIIQRITARDKAYPFDTETLRDFDILAFSFDKAFFDIPYQEYVVQNDELGRPDLISFRVYNDTDFWSFIMLYNHLADPFTDLKPTKTLRIPYYHALVSWLTRNIVQYPKS